MKMVAFWIACLLDFNVIQVWSVAYSPAGDKLVSGCDDGVLQVFERV